MAANDLNAPLTRKAKPASTRRPVVAYALISAAALIALAAAVRIAVVDDPDGGRSVAVAVITDAEPAATGSLADPSAVDSTPAAPGEEPPQLAPAEGIELSALPGIRDTPSAAAGLIEQSAFGPLPRVAPDGRRPREAYARHPPASSEGAPRVVLVIGGMGLSQTGTQNAVELLPEDITLAFAPYGSSLQRWVDKARAEGHEVLLQIPLEPIGYPEENPGEHTLTVSTDHRATSEDLAWVLARMTSYAGVMNYMGGRFLSDRKAMAPFLGEIGERGLYYLDDGASQQSLAGPVGAALQVPVVTADLIVDRVRASDAIERELLALEAIARTKGIAVGVATAFPNTVETIARWAGEAGTRGVVLVPASAAVGP